jgi:oligosaccharide 4-alpha-D-glucosyltransferase
MNLLKLKMKIIIIVICTFVWIQSSLLCEEYPSFDYLNFISYSYENDTLKVHCDNSNISIIPFTSNIIKVNLHTDFIYKDDSSYVVIMKPQKVNANFLDNGNFLSLATDSLEIRIYKNPIKMQFFKKSELLIEDDQGFFAKQGYRGVRLKLKENEAIFGAGSRPTHVNRRGQSLLNYNYNKFGYELGEANINTSIPFLISEKHYAIYFDTPSLAFCDIASSGNNILQYNSLTGTFSYFFIAGDSYQKILYSYHQLTSFQALPPRWAFGYLQSRFSYTNTKDFMDIFYKMKNENFPVDAFIFDYGWMQIDNGFGSFSWNNNGWPNPLEMNKIMHSYGINSIVVTEPFMSKETKNYNYGANNNFFCINNKGSIIYDKAIFENQALVDLFNPEARNWYFSLYKELEKTGITGWWLDMGEPETYHDDMLFYSKKEKNMHNLYSTMWIKTLYDGFVKLHPNERPFIMTRSGWSGTQRYGAIYQSGDNLRSWSQLIAQTYIFLGCSVSGVPYIHPDIGGVWSQKPQDDELYIRGMQLGTFSPIMRAHSLGDFFAEPIFYPDSVKPILRKYLNLRYQLLPYNYSLVIENALTTAPLTIPMFWVNDSPEYFNVDNQYYWGSSFLVAPIYDSASVGRKIIFPEGVWIDFWSNEKIIGNKTIYYPVNLSKIPVFVKAGSIIPFAPLMMNTSKFNYDTLIFNYYPDLSVSKSNYDLYEDDGISINSISDNKYFISKLTAEYKVNNINIVFNVGGNEYQGMSKNRIIYYKVIQPDFIPDSVSINNNIVNYYRNVVEFDKATEGYFYKDSIIICKFNWDLNPSNLQIFHTGNTTDTALNPGNDFQIYIFPNPFDEKIKIEINLGNLINTKIEISDLTGKLILSKFPDETNGNLNIFNCDTSLLSKGVYYVKIISGTNVIFRKIVKL